MPIVHNRMCFLLEACFDVFMNFIEFYVDQKAFFSWFLAIACNPMVDSADLGLMA